MKRASLGAVLTLLLAGCGGGGGANPNPAPSHGKHVIFIDIDDHGLSALWDSKSVNMQAAARGGVLAYSRADLPTHSNQNNITLLTGAFPEVTGVPHNVWLDRTQAFGVPFSLGPLSAGSYIYYDTNPLGRSVASLYSAAHDAGRTSSYVGLLPPFEHGADDVHFTIYQSKLAGFTVDDGVTQGLLKQLHYPADAVAKLHLDGPPNDGEMLNQFTLRDAAEVFKAAAKGTGSPPDIMFVWTFVALDGNPTSTEGANGKDVKLIVEDIDAGIGELLAAVKEAGYADTTSYVLTLDHGKVDANNQAVFEVQLKSLVTAKGKNHGNITPSDYKTLNEDGDAQVYAVTAGAGTAAGSVKQMAITHGLVELIQSGAIEGLDTSRTITWDGYLGTRRFYDIRSAGDHNPDILVFPQPDWTLNDVAKTMMPGPIGRPDPYGRHGGFSFDELYVPAIFWGPAFKKGVLLPAPIEHADIAATVAAALGIDPPKTAQGGAVLAALAGDTSGAETLAFPDDPKTARDSILSASGYAGKAVVLAGAAAEGAILIDVAGLYEDAFPTGAAVAGLVKAGVRFTSMQTRFRDWPVNEYELLTGSYPVRLPWVPFAEDDPAQTGTPGLGGFAMPPAANFISDAKGFDAWHSGKEVFDEQTVLAAAKAMGFATAVLGSPDFHVAHVASAGIDAVAPAGMDLKGFLAAHKKAFVLLAKDASASAADDAVAEAMAALDAAGLTGKYIIALTSRGGAPIDAPSADAHGPGSARHVPLVIAGPNFRAGVANGQPATVADIAPTLLFALGAKARTPDLAYGISLDGGVSAGTASHPLPLPKNDASGRVLISAFAH